MMETLFRLAMSGHAGAVSLDIPVCPKMFTVFRRGNAALMNCLLPGRADSSLVCLSEARRCHGRNRKCKRSRFHNGHDGLPLNCALVAPLTRDPALDL